MCGFAGYLDLRRERRIDPAILARMTATLVHRGPDSDGYFIQDDLGLGFRRLSIIDLEGGHQPLYNEDRNIVLVCNGEIFNYRELKSFLIGKGHRFRTNSDVEVLIHLYEEEGPEFINRLNGQFAFVLFDARKSQLLLARDHFGICPLFYACVDGFLLFASEIKALLKHPGVPREVDLTGLDQVISLPGVVSPRTLFKEVKSLKSGHYLVVDGGQFGVREYWDLNYPKIGEASHQKPEIFYIDALDDLLSQSVARRLQADVPVGFYLSGGLDSSLIAAVINRVSPWTQRHSFSVGFTDRSISESQFQRMVAARVQSVHHEIVFDWREISDRLTKMIYHCECPVKETYNTCSIALSEATRRSGISVILTGEGADELFAGYIGYRFDNSGVQRSKANNLESRLEEELREKMWGDRNLFYETDFHALRELKTAFYSEGVNQQLRDFELTNFDLVDRDRLRDRCAVHQRSYLDFKLRLADHLLSDHGDRMALANSVEARFPFLDIELVEFAQQIPPELKLKGFSEKYILKKVAEGKVPDRIIQREKFGFRAPGSPYLLQKNIDWIEDMLSSERIKRQGYFNPELVESLKARYTKPDARLHPHLEIDLLMIVLSFGILLEQFGLPDFN
jgi:asparagine synthase (glutamine-hydrolysing)